MSRGAVNLLSDTQTLPTAAMRRAIAGAEVGDEQLGEDPTVNALQERVAALLGHEAGLFLPSGTMCNAISFLLHVQPGEEVLLHRTSHPVSFEAGGPAALAGAMMRPLDGAGGIFDPAEIAASVRPSDDPHQPITRLVCVEQPTNFGGGRVWPLPRVREVLTAAAAHDLRTHLDGARLLNAVVASGVAASEWAGGFDTAWIDLSKGLGAPVGAVLVSDRERIGRARRFKQRLGGSMRQAGIIAAAGLYALEHHVERLADDHRRARRLADGLAQLPGVTIDPAAVETNIVIFEIDDARAFSRSLAQEGVRIAPFGTRTLRAVTHLDVDDEAIERALAAAARALGAARAA